MPLPIHNFRQASGGFRDWTVLIVEDDILAHHALVALLSSGGYSVMAAESGEEAIKLAAEEPGGLFALVDFALPGMDGLSLIHMLRTSHPDIVPILMTSNDQEEVISRAYNDSVTYMRKPIDIGQVFEILSKQTPVHM